MRRELKSLIVEVGLLISLAACDRMPTEAEIKEVLPAVNATIEKGLLTGTEIYGAVKEKLDESPEFRAMLKTAKEEYAELLEEVKTNPELKEKTAQAKKRYEELLAKETAAQVDESRSGSVVEEAAADGNADKNAAE